MTDYDRERRTAPSAAGNPGVPSLDERRVLLEERRLALENSFARKWWPTLATLVAAAIGSLFAGVQAYQASQETARARIDAELREQHDWQTKIVDLYFSRRDLFDLTKSPEAAQSNLRVLIAVAPEAVQGVLSAELQRIPSPTTDQVDPHRLDILAAAASVQQALAGVPSSRAATVEAPRPADVTVYVQYEKGSTAGEQAASAAQRLLLRLGYHVPRLQPVDAVPKVLEVRYYHPDQQSLASRLVSQLRDTVGGRVPAKAVQFQSPRPLPTGILEVWIPESAGGAP